MKAIQITLDDKLLTRLDADPEVKRLGRSAVFRQAVEAYLTRRKKRAITEAYRKAYGAALDPGVELEAWTAEGAWPEP
jgi:metal-responsive CopG/Arc/MetJ family transcriptional regulator